MKNGQNELSLQNELNELALRKTDEIGIDHIAKDGRIYASLNNICKQCGLDANKEYDRVRASSNDAQSYHELYTLKFVDINIIPSILDLANIRPGSDHDKRKQELTEFYKPKNSYSASEIKEIKQQFQSQIDQLRDDIQLLKTNQIESSIAKERIEILENFSASENFYTPTEAAALLFEGEKISAQKINKALNALGWQERKEGTVNKKDQPWIVTPLADKKGLMKNRIDLYERNKFSKDLEQNYLTSKGLIEFKRECNQRPELLK